VIDEEAAADLGAGMDIDPRSRMGNLRDDAREKRSAEAIELVGQSMADDRGDAGVADEHLVQAAGRRVAAKRRSKISFEQSSHLRHMQGEALRDLLRLPIERSVSAARKAACEP